MTVKSSRIEQFLSALRYLHEQAPDLDLEVCVRRPNRPFDDRQHGLTLRHGGSTLAEEHRDPSVGRASSIEVSPSEDPLAVAATLVAYVRGDS